MWFTGSWFADFLGELKKTIMLKATKTTFDADKTRFSGKILKNGQKCWIFAYFLKLMIKTLILVVKQCLGN